MTSIDSITLDVSDARAAEKFYADAFGLAAQLHVRASDAATSCAPATAIYTWPGFQMYAKPAGVTFDGNFIVDFTAAHTSRNIGVVGPYNQAVGDTHVHNADPAVTSGAVGDGTTQAILDPQEDNFWGVIMTCNAAGTATNIVSPGFYLTGYGTCDS
jgi:catechol 2,3-dioxygenase-like lactoylglutathione lyase family enzyme